MSATTDLRAMLDERGVEWDELVGHPVVVGTEWHDRDGYPCTALEHADDVPDGMLSVQANLTPEQAIEATLGREPWVNPAWERWHKSLKHDEIKTIGDAVEQLMYEVLEFGGDMGPNGNTYNGIDEGDVLTAGFINGWVKRFAATLGRGECELTMDGTDGCFGCSECFENIPLLANYCPNCGRKVRA